MERSVDSLTFKGSVTDAIVEAQRQKKLFLVYISGEDENSTRLEQTTWLDDRVAESISRYCIFLHLMQGSIEAIQFAAIYPQKSIPSITAVGYNGLILWRNEGYISVENFVGSIEKAWAELHFQETAVTLLTVALASDKRESLYSGSQDVAQGNTAAIEVASTSAIKAVESLEDRPSNDSQLPLEQMKGTEPSLETSLQPDVIDDVKNKLEEQTSPVSNTKGEQRCSVTRDVHNASLGNDVDVSVASKGTLALDDCCIEPSPASVEEAVVCGPESSHVTANVKEEKAKNEVAAGLTDRSSAMKLDDINFNVRLPSGTSLQRRFMITDTLRSVKNYVDENQTGAIGSYDLAVPYPRRVFNEQDMNSVLSELGFAARQALIVVPHPVRPQRGVPSSSDSENSVRVTESTDDNGGYFALVKRVLSYINPFSYHGSSSNSSNSETAASHGSQQYRPNQAFQSRQFLGGETSSPLFGLNQQDPSAGGSAGETRRRGSRPFGSNIHTLRHDEDDYEPRDRNTFWNGNSTEFGGDDKK